MATRRHSHLQGTSHCPQPLSSFSNSVSHLSCSSIHLIAQPPLPPPTLKPSRSLVPELQTLRIPCSERSTFVPAHAPLSRAGLGPRQQQHWAHRSDHEAGSLQLELVATFSWDASQGNPSSPFGVSVLNGSQVITIDCKGDNEEAPGGCMVGAVKSKGPLLPLGSSSVRVHVYVDGEIVESIFNNRTALVTYQSPPNKDATAVELFGVGAGVEGSVKSWQLKQANNF